MIRVTDSIPIVHICFHHIVETTTGISAHDRSLTMNSLANANSTTQDFVRPGHVFPLQYQPGGVLVRRGHTEASIDLCRLANMQPAAAISELVLDNGKMMRRDDLAEFAHQHQLTFITIDDLVKYIENKIKQEGIDWVVA
jgi:3,4-dihydroxy-2-butanone 4-phosphate synthase